MEGIKEHGLIFEESITLFHKNLGTRQVRPKKITKIFKPTKL